ncbi:hypothetical protein GGR56DRAFT_17704 [Xylariaceae sp. FL0804]|nr:hypothetical protein GGR56DRAFT_17704 [Xylariaceae sp. FL0804]
MLPSWILRHSLFIALATTEVWANSNHGGGGLARKLAPAEMAGGAQVPTKRILLEGIEYVVVERRLEDVMALDEILGASTSIPRERATPALCTPGPTAPPQKRQDDDGQVEALSSQVQSLSSSVTEAISSVSSSASSAISLISASAQSVQQSADQAIQSANQNADDAFQQLSQTESSASSAISQAQSIASSQISASLFSAESSASSAISAAQVAASSFAASRVQEALLQASGAQGDASSLVQQVRSNSISGTNVAIIASVSVVATAVISAIVSCLIMRYRRKKKQPPEEDTTALIKEERTPIYRKPVAVRESPAKSPATPRFTPFGGGTGYPMDKFKLPSLSPILSKKKMERESWRNIGFATSDYGNAGNRESSADGAGERGGGGIEGDVYGVSPRSFRLQKPDNIQNATTVKLIRVGSEKSKGKKAQLVDDPAPLPSPLPVVNSSPPPTEPLPASPPPAVTQPPRTSPRRKPPPQQQAQARASVRAVGGGGGGARDYYSGAADVRDSVVAEVVPAAAARVSQQPPLAPPPRSSAAPGPPTARSTMLRFRDSSDVESAEPTPLGGAWRSTTASTSLRNTNTASLRASTRSGSGYNPGIRPPGGPQQRPKNAGSGRPSFATFPRVPSSSTSRGVSTASASAAAAALENAGGPTNTRQGLAGVAARLRDEAERRRRESAEVFRNARTNWPLNGGGGG